MMSSGEKQTTKEFRLIIHLYNTAWSGQHIKLIVQPHNVQFCLFQLYNNLIFFVFKKIK